MQDELLEIEIRQILFWPYFCTYFHPAGLSLQVDALFVLGAE
jgi:hypothetical protein